MVAYDEPRGTQPEGSRSHGSRAGWLYLGDSSSSECRAPRLLNLMKATDEGRHDPEDARLKYAVRNSRSRTRDARERTLPTDHSHAARPRDAGVTREYQRDSSSKRPAFSVTDSQHKNGGHANYAWPPRLLSYGALAY